MGRPAPVIRTKHSKTGSAPTPELGPKSEPTCGLPTPALDSKRTGTMNAPALDTRGDGVVEHFIETYRSLRG